MAVNEFLSKELSCLIPSSAESILYERFYRANTAVTGLDCICELNFSWTKSSLWACNVCFVAGKTLDSADSHLYSSLHKQNYIKEHYPEQYEELLRNQKDSTSDKHFLLEHEALLNILYETKGLSPPDVYILREKERSWAFEKLGLKEESTTSPDYVLEPISDIHQIVLCNMCGESFLAYEKEELFLKAWQTHLSTNNHQKCCFLKTLIQDINPREVNVLPLHCSVRKESNFYHSNDTYYGPSCGYEYMVIFKDSNLCFCQLCFCVVENRLATEHFSSEYHIERFVRRISPSKLLNAQYMETEERQEILLQTLENNRSQAIKCFQSDELFPQLLEQHAKDEIQAFERLSPEETKIGTFKAIWCEDCKHYVKLSKTETWKMHIFEEEHFDWASKRNLYYIDKEFFVSKVSTLPSFKHACKDWEERFSVSLGVVSVQDHCHYGLKYVVRDELSRQSLCTCCYFSCSYDEDDVMGMHVRTYEHISRVLHLLNKKFVGIIWKYSDVAYKKIALLDYLKNCKLDPLNTEKLTVYDPVSASTINCLGTIPKQLLELAKLAPHLRLPFLDGLANCTDLKDGVLLNSAMRQFNVEMKAIEMDIVIFFCQDCNQAFSAPFNKVIDKFSEHIISTSHWTRYVSLYKDNLFDENKKSTTILSSFEVTPFEQINDKKKITWKWNDTRKCFEFVYAQLGLSDIRERRNFKSKRDLFCSVCAESFKAAKNELEHHIRSFSHIFYYVHKHRSTTIPELEAILLEPDADLGTKHKNVRRLFARALKGMEKERGDIFIYDFSYQFCESAEVKNALEDIAITPEVDRSNTSTNNLSIYTNRVKMRTPEEIKTFINDIYQKISSSTSLEEFKRRILNEVEFESAPEPETNGPERPIENTNGNSVMEISPSSNQQKSTEKRKSRSRSPNYKKFHAEHNLLLQRPAFARFGGAYAYAATKMSPTERRPIEYSIGKDRRLTPKRGKSRSPARSKHRSRSRSRHRSRSRSRTRRRSRTPSKRSSRSPRRSRRSSERRKRSSSPKTSRSYRRHSSRSRSKSRRRSRSKSASKSDESSPIMQQKLLNRLKNAPNKIQINIPKANSPPPTSTQYRIRNAPDPNSIQQNSIKREKDNSEELRSGSRPSKSRWDKTDKELSKNLPPALMNAPRPPSSTRRGEFLPGTFTDKENGDSSAVLQTTTINIAELEAEAQRLSDFSNIQSTEADIKEVVRKALATGNVGNIDELQAALNEKFKAVLSQPPPIYNPPPTCVNLCGPPQPAYGLPFPAATSLPYFHGSAGFPPVSGTFSAPPPFNFQAPPPGFQAPPPGYLAPPGGYLAQPPIQQQAPVVVDQTEIVMHAKMQLYSKDLLLVKDITELIEYLWKQGYEKISPDDPPLLFNEVVKKRRGALGANTLYQIICYGHPELETYYCGMCNHWTTVSEMFNHLCSAEHRMNYMFRNYKMYHKKALDEKNLEIQEILLEKFAVQIWNLEGSGQCGHRMRCILNEEAISRLWPDYVNCIDNSWKIIDLEDTIDNVLINKAETAQISQHVETTKNQQQGSAETAETNLKPAENPLYQNSAQENLSLEKALRDRAEKSGKVQEKTSDSKRRSPTHKRGRSSRSKSRSPSRKSQRRSSDEKDSKTSRRGRVSPNASDERRRRHRSRSRNRSQHSRSKSPNPKDSKKESWDQKAAAFLDRIGDRRNAMKLYMASINSDDMDLTESTTSQDSRNNEKHEQYQEKSLDERICEMAPRNMNLREREALQMQLQQMEQSKRSAPPPNIAAAAAPARQRPTQPVDEKTIMRKAIGAMVVLESIYESEHRMDAETIFKVANDVGIDEHQVVNNNMLREIATTFNVDLDGYYQRNYVNGGAIEEIGNNSASHSSSNVRDYDYYHNERYPTTSSSTASNYGSGVAVRGTGHQPVNEKAAQPNQLDLKALGAVPASNNAAQSSTTSVSQANEPPRYSARSEYQEPEMSEEISYVYPGYELDNEEVDIERDPDQIETSINALTFAFGKKQRKPSAKPPRAEPNAQKMGQQNAQKMAQQNAQKMGQQNAQKMGQQKPRALNAQNYYPSEYAQNDPNKGGMYSNVSQRVQCTPNEGKTPKPVKAKKPPKPNANLEPLGTIRTFGSAYSKDSSGFQPPPPPPPPAAPEDKVFYNDDYDEDIIPLQQSSSRLSQQRAIERGAAPKVPSYAYPNEDRAQQHQQAIQQGWADTGNPQDPRVKQNRPVNRSRNNPQNYDFTTDWSQEDYQPARDQPPAKRSYRNMAAEIGDDDWDSLGSHMNNILNPKNK